jgi:DNA invertase Pin-like site-specific DNA recombinase
MNKAYSYVRFSSKSQEEGHSLDRQLKSARAYAATHNLVLDDSSYQDLGVSAFKGGNVVDGKLGLFIAAVEAGRIPKGSFLLVESLDRISRNVITEAQVLFLRIINLDITIVTMLDGQVFSKEKINEDGGISVIISLLYMLRAHEESKTKSKRVLDGWEEARKKKIITRVCPAWLSVVNDDWVLNEPRVEVVKKIFKLALEGNGSPSIAKMLEIEKIPTFSFASYGWSSGMVANILNSKAVMGILSTPKVPHREGYFPVIIPKEVFFNVRQISDARNKSPGIRGNGAIVNLFSGRTFCGKCGAKMKTLSAKKSIYVYYACENNFRFNAGENLCDCARVPHTQFEEAILEVLIGIQKRNFIGLPVEIMVDPLPGWRAELVAVERSIEKQLDFMLTMPKSDALMRRFAASEVERDAIKKKLISYVPVSSTREAIAGVTEAYESFMELDKDSDEYKKVRAELCVGLRRVVKKIVFHHLPAEGDKEWYQITFQSGTVRDWYYYRLPKGTSTRVKKT